MGTLYSRPRSLVLRERAGAGPDLQTPRQPVAGGPCRAQQEGIRVLDRPRGAGTWVRRGGPHPPGSLRPPPPASEVSVLPGRPVQPQALLPAGSGFPRGRQYVETLRILRDVRCPSGGLGLAPGPAFRALPWGLRSSPVTHHPPHTHTPRHSRGGSALPPAGRHSGQHVPRCPPRREVTNPADQPTAPVPAAPRSSRPRLPPRPLRSGLEQSHDPDDPLVWGQPYFHDGHMVRGQLCTQ